MAAGIHWISMDTARRFAEVLAEQRNLPLHRQRGFADGLCAALIFADNAGPEVLRVDREQVAQIFREGVAQNSEEGILSIVQRIKRLVYPEFLGSASSAKDVQNIIADYV
jgi:hypothetical protein